MAREGWTPVSRRNLCPICGKPNNCSLSTDGKYAYCGRVADGSVKENNGGQWLHVLRDDDDDWRRRDWEWTSPRTSPRERQADKPDREFGKQADVAFSHPDAPRKRRELADRLGVEPFALERMGVGWEQEKRKQGCWTIPERDATGDVIGISTRLANGDKLSVFGGQRGLTFIDGWQDGDGPILLVEGGSDVAACLSMGCSVVGRPSNLSGVDHLTELLRSVPDDRDVIVIGENDRKSHDSLATSVRERHKPECEGCSLCWPGRLGAIQTAEKLRELLCRTVGWSLTPDGLKDVRGWLNAMRKGAGE